MGIIDLVRYRITSKRTHIMGIILIMFVAFFVTFLNLGLEKEFIGDDASVGYHYPGTRLNMVVNMWNSYIFPGKSDTIGTISLMHIGSINLLNKLGISLIVIDRLFYFLFFFVSGVGMYFLSHHILISLFTVEKNSVWFIALIGAVFYMLNNFTMILLSFPPTNYAYSYMFLPWIFFLYLKNFHISSSLWRRLMFVVISILLLSGNPSNTISIVFLLLIYEIFFRKDNKIIQNFKKFVLTLSLILLLTSYIFLPVFGNQANPYGTVSSSENRSSIEFSSSETSIEKLLILRGHHSQDTFVFDKFLLSSVIIIANYGLLMIAFFFFLRKKRDGLVLFLFLIFILFLFLAKAEHDPLSLINRFIYDNFPLFEMYRASYFKFVYFCVFVISIMLPVSLLKINSAFLESGSSLLRKSIIASTLMLIFICAKPFMWGDVVRSIHKTTIPDAYHNIGAYFNNVKTDISVLAIPQLASNLTLDWGGGNYYAGGNPDMFFLNKPVWSNGWFLPKNKISNQWHFYKSILHKFNISYIFLHKDIPEKYSFDIDVRGTLNGKTDFEIFNNQIMADNELSVIHEDDFFKVFKINKNIFNPHFLVSNKSIVSRRSMKDLPVVLASNYSIVFFAEQNIGKKDILDKLKDNGGQDGSESIDDNNAFTSDSLPAYRQAAFEQVQDEKILPILEFKKINPTKYRVRVHGAHGVFPLVFSESFHEGWKGYLAKPSQEERSRKQEASLDNYKILDGNEQDQATKGELREFIEKGWVTPVSLEKFEGAGEKEIKHMKWEDGKERIDYVEKYQIDFVSKNFQGTIQNDNLPKGSIFETWFQKPLPEDNHLMANGYANSWVIDTNAICDEGNMGCTKNPNGSYDFEIIVEFWPQRLFYIGLFMSGVTLFGCLVYLAYDWRNRRKSEGACSRSVKSGPSILE